MTQTETQKAVHDQIFYKYLTLSVAAHIAIALFFAMKGLFYSSETIIIQKAIHVDLVGLPDKMEPEQVAEAAQTSESTAKPEPAKTEAPSKPKAAEAAKPTVNLKSNKKEDLKDKQKKALDKLKAMDALERIESEVQAQKKQKLIKGAVVSTGDSLTGLDRIEYERYFGDVEQHLRKNWQLPSWMMELDVRAQALVQIDDKGYVTLKKMVTPSGNSEFDEKVMESIDRSSPFPPPPERLVGVLKNRGIIFNFPK